MRSRRTAAFRRTFAALPERVQRASARGLSALSRDNPNNPGLRFKRVHPTDPVFSVRIGVNYRAVGTLEGDVMIWFWIGSHADYDALLSRR